MGVLSLLAVIDPHDGVVTEKVSRTHSRNDFIAFLMKLDSTYHEVRR